MRQRGRPPHPDILTPREWEVLSLLREGLSNRDIGDRLGVTRDGIKYHVAQILLKLGVATREEAAAWDPAALVEVAPTNRLAARLSGVSRLGLIGAAGVLLTGVAALAGAVTYNEFAGGGSSTGPADVSAGGPPTASPGPYGVPTPTPFWTPAPPYGASNNALGSVAYVKDGNLWLLNLDTGEDRMIVQREVATTFGTTAKDLTAFDPEWSADGQWIAFGINNAAIDYNSGWIVRPSDSLVEFGGGGDGSDWSPVDLSLFGAGELFRPVGSFGPDFAHYANSSFVTNVAFGEAKWSPDGARLAAASANTSYIGQTGKISVNPPYAVKIIDPQSARPSTAPQGSYPAGVTTVYRSDDGAGPPLIHSWSPDGKYIMFWPSPGDAAIADLYILSVDNPGDAHVVGQAPVDPSGVSWSPDSSLIAIVQAKDDASNTAINVLRPDGTLVADIAGGTSLEPAWSTDQSHLAYSQGGHIWTAIAAQGGESTQRTQDSSYADRYPQWSRESSHIVFVRLNTAAVEQGVAGSSELWIMNSDGSDQHKIADLPAIDLATQGKAGFMDWARYLSWYRPSGNAPLPLRTASPPSGAPTFPAGVTPLPSPLGTKPPPGR